MVKTGRYLWASGRMRTVMRLIAITSAIFVVISMAGFFFARSLPAEIKQETPLVRYEHQGAFDYLIFLKPSNLFGSPGLEPPSSAKYPSEIVDTIDFTFTYTPTGRSAATGSVDVILESTGIWHKSVRLASGSSGGEAFVLRFPLDTAYFNSLFDDIEKQIGAKGSRNIVIQADVTSGGEHFVQKLPVIISGGLIELASNLSLTKFSGVGTFDYIVNLKAPALGVQNPKYPVSIVEKIDFTFDYSPVKPGAVTGWIEAVIENPGIWRKSIRLASNTSATGDLTIFFPLEFNNYQNLYNDIEKEIKITSPSRDVTLIAYVNVGGEQFVQSLPVKVSPSLIEIDSGLRHSDLSGTGTFDYKVQLKTNTVYGTQTLDAPEPTVISSPPMGITLGLSPAAITPPVTLKPGDQIFAKLVDRMDATFQYRLKADKPIKSRVSDVTVTAVVEAPKLWSKTFVLLNIRKSEDFKINFPVELDRYAKVFEAIRTETGTSPESYDLTISANVHTVAETDFGRIDETFTQTMKSTLKSGVLEWDKELTKTVPSSIKKTKVVLNSKTYLGLSISGVKTLSGVLAAILSILFLLSTVAYIKIKPLEIFNLENEVLKIKKKYGERMAETIAQGPLAGEAISMASMEDLIKIADELAKPITHQASEPKDSSSTQTIHIYSVIDGLIRYEYVLRARDKEIADENHV